MKDEMNDSLPKYVKEAIRLYLWLQEKEFKKYPKKNCKSNQDEIDLANIMYRLENKIVMPYEVCYTMEDEDKYFEKMERKYGLEKKHIDFIVAVMKKIKIIKENELAEKRKIAEEKARKKQEELEKKKAKKERIVKYRVKDGSQRIIELKLNRKYRSKKLPKRLRNARKIKRWMVENNTTRPPKKEGFGVSEEEAKLGRLYSGIKHSLIKPYYEAETDEQKEEFFKKIKLTGNLSKDEFGEILQIFEEIEKSNIPRCLENARNIRTWMKSKKTLVPPSPEAIDADEEEKRLGRAYYAIKRNILKPYLDCQTDEERASALKKLAKTAHLSKEQFFEIKTIIDEIDLNKNNVKTPSAFLTNAIEIKKWMQKNHSNLPPSIKKRGINSREKKLGIAWSNLINLLVRPYLRLESDEEREEFLGQFGRIDREDMDQILAVTRDIFKMKKSKSRISFDGIELGKATYSSKAEECDDASSVINDLLQEKELNDNR